MKEEMQIFVLNDPGNYISVILEGSMQIGTLYILTSYMIHIYLHVAPIASETTGSECPAFPCGLLTISRQVPATIVLNFGKQRPARSWIDTYCTVCMYVVFF